MKNLFAALFAAAVFGLALYGLVMLVRVGC